MLSDVLGVLHKELLDAWRDWKTWLLALLLPLVLSPLMILIVAWLAGSYANEEAPVVMLVNPEVAPELTQVLMSVEGVEWLHSDADAKPDLRLVFGPADGTPMNRTITLEYDSGSKTGPRSALTIQRVLDRVALDVARRQLAGEGLDSDLIPMLRVSLKDTGNAPDTSSALLSMMLPMMLLVSAATGGIYAAVDAVAGEKERGTLEVLFSTPANRSALYLGKYLAILAPSWLSMAFAVLGIFAGVAATKVVFPSSTLQFNLSMSSGLLLLLVGIVVASLFAAINMALSTLAKNYREAQSFTSPVAMVPMLVATFSTGLDLETASGGLFAVPILNAAMLVRELLSDRFVASHFVMTLVIMGAMSALALALASRLFHREGVLYRS